MGSHRFGAGLRWPGIAVALLTLTGCWWSQPGFDAGGSGFNGVETAISPATVGTLAEVWSASVAGEVRGVVQSSSRRMEVFDTTGVYGLDPASGAERWATPVAGLADPNDSWSLQSNLAASGADVVIGAGAAAVPGDAARYRLDTATGDVLEVEPLTASHPGTGGIDTTRHSTVRSGPWSATVSTISWFDFFLLARVATSFVRVTHQDGTVLTLTPPPGEGAIIEVDSAPIIVGGRLYVAGFTLHSITPPFDVRGHIRGWDLSTQACGGSGCPPTFDLDLPSQATPDLLASPDKMTLYVGSSNRLAAVDVASQAVLWQGTGTMTGPATWTPAGVATPSGNVLSVYPHGCGAPTCDPDWSTPLPGTPVGDSSERSMAAVGGLLFVAVTGGTVAAYPTACTDGCSPVWSTNVGSEITAPPVVSSGRLFVGTADGRVVAFAPGG